jgi:hypothetical protein
VAQHHLSSAFISGYISHGWPLKHIKDIKALICWWFDHMSQSMTHWNVHPSCLLDNHILTKSTSLGMSHMIRYMTMYRRLYIYTYIHDIYIHISCAYIYIYISCALYIYIHSVYMYIFIYHYMYICTMVAITPTGTRWEATSLHALVLAHQARVRVSQWGMTGRLFEASLSCKLLEKPI